MPLPLACIIHRGDRHGHGARRILSLLAALLTTLLVAVTLPALFADGAPTLPLSTSRDCTLDGQGRTGNALRVQGQRKQAIANNTTLRSPHATGARIEEQPRASTGPGPAIVQCRAVTVQARGMRLMVCMCVCDFLLCVIAQILISTSLLLPCSSLHLAACPRSRSRCTTAK